MAIKLTKNEQKVQKDNLKQFERYLPTLQLKKQQLQTVIMKENAELEQMEIDRTNMIGDLDDWIAVFAENTIFSEDRKLDQLVQPDSVIATTENIAGVSVPLFKELTFKDIAYDVDDYPLWVDTALVKLRGIARLDALVATKRKRVEALEKELLAQNANFKSWACTEDMMKHTKDGKALYLHCLPADISGLSCPEGEVDNSVFDRYIVPLYKQASYKPYIIAAMIFLAQVKDPVRALMEMDKSDAERKMF